MQKSGIEDRSIDNIEKNEAYAISIKYAFSIKFLKSWFETTWKISLARICKSDPFLEKGYLHT